MTQGQHVWQLKGYAINFSIRVIGRTESVEWAGLMPECFWDRCGDDVCRQFFQKAWFWKGGETQGAWGGGGCGPKAVGLQQCFSNWDLWKYSQFIRPENLNTHTPIQIVCPECPLVTENYLGISVALILFVFTIKSQPGSNTLKTFQQKLFLLHQTKDDLHGSKHLFLCWQEHWPHPVCDLFQLWRCLNQNEYSQWKMLRS